MKKAIRQAIEKAKKSIATSQRLPDKPSRSRIAFDSVTGQQVCRSCHSPRSAGYFRNFERAGRMYRDSQCDECRRMAHICRNHALSAREYRSIMGGSDGKCSICRRSFSASIRPNIDHCHSTGMLRSLLCVACNSALGLFRDDADIVLAAVAYLEHWRRIHADCVPTEADALRNVNMAKIRARAKGKQ
jgi:Recombination endonuclease VII